MNIKERKRQTKQIWNNEISRNNKKKNIETGWNKKWVKKIKAKVLEN